MSAPTRDLGLCFAGGGNRAFWQIGLLDALGARVLGRVSAMSACSAGAAAAVILSADAVERAERAFADLRRDVHRNLDPARLVRGEPAMPHERIYRATMHAALEDGGFERLRAQPYPILILVAEPHARLRGPLGLAAGLTAYQLEKLLRPHALHPTVAPRLGFRGHLHDARACGSAEELVDLVLASSATPPVTREGRYAGRRLLDGSLVDNAPAFALDGLERVERTLVLLTRPYPEGATGLRGRRLYLAPTRAVPAERWDYRAVAPIAETRALGRDDARVHAPALDAFL